MGFTVREGELVTGTPSIEVDWSGGSREVNDATAVTVKADPATYLGVYLDYEGTVHVTATLHAMDACDWTAKGTTTITRGQRSMLTVELKPLRETCATHPDAGAPIVEAGTDGPADAEVGPTLVPDAEDVSPKLPACLEYCATYLGRCRQWDPELKNMDCVKECVTWPAGDPDASAGQNTLACRLTFLRSAVGDGPPCSMCPAASPASAGMCNASLVDAGPRDACPPSAYDGGEGS